MEQEKLIKMIETSEGIVDAGYESERGFSKRYVIATLRFCKDQITVSSKLDVIKKLIEETDLEPEYWRNYYVGQDGFDREDSGLDESSLTKYEDLIEKILAVCV